MGTVTVMATTPSKKQDETPVTGPTAAEVKGAEKARQDIDTTTPAEAGNEVGRRMGEQDASSTP